VQAAWSADRDEKHREFVHRRGRPDTDKRKVVYAALRFFIARHPSGIFRPLGNNYMFFHHPTQAVVYLNLIA
jgi:hypothetical protein